ncbi:uncharacterized protein LOC6544300 [Drosophila erecta]|uniref:Uncharacterized protein n=1 Tax=Drosophila erecta TaxID=7220 RepID=B3NFC6_DROER|nr:uncharacterized protein LOC6544300 [Drosophila erecta]EDV50468.1 uncharacterized protein Dere_GG14427 [Drosophila erecta]
MTHVALLLAIASVFSVVQGQEVMPMPVAEAPTSQPLPADYVKGILSLKSSLLSSKPALGYSSQQGNSADPVSGIRPGMRYTQQLDVQQPQSQPLQEIQVEHVASLRPSALAQSNLLPSQMPSAKLNRYNQEFPAFHLFQPPFVPMPKKQERQESLDPPPTAEQLELLQQLSEFFGQRQQLQQVRPQLAMNSAQVDQSEGKGEGTDTCDTTQKPNESEEEDSISVDVKNEEQATTTTTTTSAKPFVPPKTKPTKPSNVKSTTQKHLTTRDTKSTTRKLPCCTKPMNKGVASPPNVNVQNAYSEQPKSLQQQPRSGRHAIQPDLRINAITNLLRYRRKRAQGAAPYPKPFSSQTDPGLQLQSRSKRKKDKILDKNQLLQAELKIWPINIKANFVEQIH